MRRSNRIWPSMRSSSPVRLPLVFSSSIAMTSMVCRASASSFSTLPVSGLGASPMCTSAEWLSDSTQVAKSTPGRLSSGTAASPLARRSAVAAAQGGLRDDDVLGLVGRVGETRDVLLDILVVKDALLQVALANADVPLPVVDGLGGVRHGFSLV